MKLERWQGPPDINKVKQSVIVLSFKVSLLFSLFSHENKESLLLFGLLIIKKKKKKNLSQVEGVDSGEENL